MGAVWATRGSWNARFHPILARRRRLLPYLAATAPLGAVLTVLLARPGAYTLAQDAHVRGDFLYSSMRPRTQATLDLVLYIVFFLPGIAALAGQAHLRVTYAEALRQGYLWHEFGDVHLLL